MLASEELQTPVMRAAKAKTNDTQRLHEEFSGQQGLYIVDVPTEHKSLLL